MRKPSALEILLLLSPLLIIVVVVAMARADELPKGDLYAFCDSDAEKYEICNQSALMLKDVCEETVRVYTDSSDRFSCAQVDDATRDAYMQSVERDVYERTIEAWEAGR